MCVYLHVKFEVSSIILMSFRQVVILHPLPLSPTGVNEIGLLKNCEKFTGIFSFSPTVLAEVFL